MSIRVTVELLPHGDESKAQVLGRLTIVNDGSGDDYVGHYAGVLEAEYTTGRSGRVREFQRGTHSVWSLIGAFLTAFGHTKHSPKNIEAAKTFPRK